MRTDTDNTVCIMCYHPQNTTCFTASEHAEQPRFFATLDPRQFKPNVTNISSLVMENTGLVCFYNTMDCLEPC